MSNSTLASFVKILPHKDSPRNEAITKITIHHMAGNLSVETCYNVLYNGGVSAHYGVGTDGRIGRYLDEADRSWASASRSNDHKAVTIEVANDEHGGQWHVSDKALEATIDLCVDICERNGIKKLNYTGDTSGNLTRHNMFISTTCPGPYLQSKFPYIAEEVNKRLGAIAPTAAPTKSVEEVAQEVIAGKWGNGDTRRSKLEAAGYSYSEVQNKVNEILSGKKPETPVKSVNEIAEEVINGKWGVGEDRKRRLEAAGYNYDEVQAKVNALVAGEAKKSITQIAQEVIGGKWGNGDERKNKIIAAGYDYDKVQDEVNRLLKAATPAKELKIGSKVQVKNGAKDYNGNKLASFVYKTKYTVIEISGDRVVIGAGRIVIAAVHKDNIDVV